jgi:hypothetical protein
MAERTWFFASESKQQGPYPEQQFRMLITQGVVSAETLIWTDGMADWQRAGDVPGLVSSAAPPPAMAGSFGTAAATRAPAGGAVTAEFSTFGLFGRVLLFVIGTMLIIPAPWTATILYRFVVEHLRVPQRPNLSFTGQPLDIWYVFVLTGLVSYAGLSDIWWLPIALLPVNAFLAWMVVRWVTANIASDGQKLPIQFVGNLGTYVGWLLLLYVSIVTIIGWAWATTAFIRWLCRNISGTRREVVFNGSGWDVLWRTIVTVLACILIIPIPWMLKWLASWYVSQFALVQREASAAV